ncbi:hypothetical protein LSTR_LSTR003100 [Laodelphax striatellus]|uniref:Uncharacterized protein n=1 Tax=Laodelphax striatellus TaxID=195883 RepID=A0A482WVN3_LAOST|nr:hypothetical protein LSTR_LSTR003100 [Laodelphax striatellus]
MNKKEIWPTGQDGIMMGIECEPQGFQSFIINGQHDVFGTHSNFERASPLKNGRENEAGNLNMQNSLPP